MTGSNDYGHITEKHLDNAEKAALKALDAGGLSPEDIRDYYVEVTDAGLVFWHGKFPQALSEPPLDEKANIAITGTMLWACCRYAKAAKYNDHWKMFEIGREIGRMMLALQFPEFRQEIMEEKMQMFQDCGERGGKSHHKKERKAFKKRYRKIRNSNPAPRSKIVEDLLGMNEWLKMASTTLLSWAKKADKKDRYKRTAGRPSK